MINENHGKKVSPSVLVREGKLSEADYCSLIHERRGDWWEVTRSLEMVQCLASKWEMRGKEYLLFRPFWGPSWSPKEVLMGGFWISMHGLHWTQLWLRVVIEPCLCSQWKVWSESNGCVCSAGRWLPWDSYIRLISELTLLRNWETEKTGYCVKDD